MYSIRPVDFYYEKNATRFAVTIIELCISANQSSIVVKQTTIRQWFYVPAQATANYVSAT